MDDLKKQPIRKNNLITGGGIVAVKMLSHAPATNADEPICVGEKYYEIVDIIICENCIEEFARTGEVNG